MRYFFGLMCVLALGVMGCSETSGTGGFPCTEQGIHDAIDEGGGPHTFACNGPTTVDTTDTIVLANDVILDGEGNLTVVGDHENGVFEAIATAELRGFEVTGENTIINLHGILTLTDCTVSGGLVGIQTSNWTELTMTNSTVSGNDIGISNDWGIELKDSTVSGNRIGISGHGVIEMKNSTVSGNTELGVDNSTGGLLVAANSLIDGGCGGDGDFDSAGYNIESPGDTCGFDQTGDQVNVSADDLKLGELADNGGLTETHALGDGSVAIDQIPAEDCEVDTDQRGEPRPETGGTMCDVGSVEVQP